MRVYQPYHALDYNKGLTPATYVTTPVASYNHTCCSHSPTFSDLPVKVLHRCEVSGVQSVVLRGCISFNPMYREYSRYNPYLLSPRARVIPSEWRRETLFEQYRSYLLWLVALINEFTIIHYVELLNEYHFCNACYVPHNKRLLFDIISYWRKVIKPMSREVQWGVSEPLIGAANKAAHLRKVNNWRSQLGLDYTGVQLHLREELVTVTRSRYKRLAITENYTGLSPGEYTYVCER